MNIYYDVPPISPWLMPEVTRHFLSNMLAFTHKFFETTGMVSALIAGLEWEENGRIKGLIAQK